ncbi:MAG: hypothetical protein R2864_05640 [Syntrophotaleaceae bacterium]
MIFYCPLAFSGDCNQNKCSFYGTVSCVDGQLRVSISDHAKGRVVPCPRAQSRNCNARDCSLWGTSRCTDGEVNIHMQL